MTESSPSVSHLQLCDYCTEQYCNVGTTWGKKLWYKFPFKLKIILFLFRHPLLILLYFLIFTNIFRNTSFHLLPASHPFINGSIYHSALLVLDVRSMCCSGIQCPFYPRPNVSVSLLNPRLYLRTFVKLLSFA
jgi:hypothetical protein